MGETTPYSMDEAVKGNSMRCSHFSLRDSRLTFWLRFFFCSSNFIEMENKERRKERKCAIRNGEH